MMRIDEAKKNKFINYDVQRDDLQGRDDESGRERMFKSGEK
jgi:hypothetical protein